MIHIEQIYEQYNTGEERCNDEVKDEVYNKILEEDLIFDNNNQKLNLNGNKIHVELLMCL